MMSFCPCRRNNPCHTAGLCDIITQLSPVDLIVLQHSATARFTHLLLMYPSVQYRKCMHLCRPARAKRKTMLPCRAPADLQMICSVREAVRSMDIWPSTYAQWVLALVQLHHTKRVRHDEVTFKKKKFQHAFHQGPEAATTTDSSKLVFRSLLGVLPGSSELLMASFVDAWRRADRNCPGCVSG